MRLRRMPCDWKNALPRQNRAPEALGLQRAEMRQRSSAGRPATSESAASAIAHRAERTGRRGTARRGSAPTTAGRRFDPPAPATGRGLTPASAPSAPRPSAGCRGGSGRDRCRPARTGWAAGPDCTSPASTSARPRTATSACERRMCMPPRSLTPRRRQVNNSPLPLAADDQRFLATRFFDPRGAAARLAGLGLVRRAALTAFFPAPAFLRAPLFFPAAFAAVFRGRGRGSPPAEGEAVSC